MGWPVDQVRFSSCLDQVIYIYIYMYIVSSPVQVREHRDESLATPETSTNSKAMAEMFWWKEFCHFGRCFGVFCQEASMLSFRKSNIETLIQLESIWCNIWEPQSQVLLKTHARYEAVLQLLRLFWSLIILIRRDTSLISSCSPCICEVGHLTVRQPRGKAWSCPTFVIGLIHF